MRDVSHVIIVNDSAALNGGQAKVAMESAKGLKRAGVDVTYFACHGTPDPLLAAEGIRTVWLGQHDILTDPNRARAMSQGLWNRPAASALSRLLREFDPQTSVVHCHGVSKALSPSVGPVLTRGPLRSVFTIHEFFLACPNGGFFDYQRQEICHRQPLGRDCLSTHCDPRRYLHKAWRVTRQLMQQSIGNLPRGLRDIIYISQGQRAVMAPHLPAQARLYYVPNPVDIAAEPRVRAEDNDVFLFVGRLAPEKGALSFARAAKAAGVRAVFVGDGDERAAIQQLDAGFELVGWQPPEVVKQWLRRSRALVFPSLWYETFGLVAFEALASGVPVICGEWNVASEAVIDGVNGALYASPEPAHMVDAIQRVNRSVSAMSVEAHHRYWRQPLTLAHHVDRLLDTYAETLTQHASVPV